MMFHSLIALAAPFLLAYALPQSNNLNDVALSPQKDRFPHLDSLDNVAPSSLNHAVGPLGKKLNNVALSSQNNINPLQATRGGRGGGGDGGTSDGPIGFATQNGGTSGGAGGQTVHVSSLNDLVQAAGSNGPAIIIVSGAISGHAMVPVASDKTILGADSSAGLLGVGLYIKGVSNIIIRNLAIAKVPASIGVAADAIHIAQSTNIWIDHMDLSSDMAHGIDYYDGLCDIIHGSDWITISNTRFHDHAKGSLVGASDSNGAEDTGRLHVTYANNVWTNMFQRLPSIRFGAAHVFNSYYEGADSGVNTRDGAQVLVESTVFSGVKYPITSRDSPKPGGAVVNDVDLGGAQQDAPEGTLTSVPYQYSLLGSQNVQQAVMASAGNTMTFGGGSGGMSTLNTGSGIGNRLMDAGPGVGNNLMISDPRSGNTFNPGTRMGQILRKRAKIGDGQRHAASLFKAMVFEEERAPSSG